jgi:putative SOS response-associated peptidase YedK
MCGRYASTRDPATLATEFDAVDAAGDEAASYCDFNIAPTKPVLAVVTRHPRDEEGTPDPERTERSIRVMRWGLVPHWAKDPSVGSRLINARAESAADKPAFRTALATRRCLLPADGWFEWQRSDGPGGRKQPYFVTPADGSGVALAGLWATWRSPDAEPDEPPLVSCAVLTTGAVGRLTAIHHRMPLVLPAESWPAWLDPDSADPGVLLGGPAPELVEAMELRPVSTAVNSVRNNGAELVEPVSVEPVPDQPALLDLDQVR